MGPAQQQQQPQTLLTQQATQQPQQPQQPQQQQQQQMNNDLFDHATNQLTLTLRLLMQGKEVGGVIGKKGDNIKRFREVSGAKINVSESSTPDRIVTLTGLLEEVYGAFAMICSKFEQQLLNISSSAPGSVSGAIMASSTSPNVNESNADSGGGGQSVNMGSSANPGGPNAQSPTSVTNPLFGLPSAGILNNALKDADIGIKEEPDMITINNNSTTTINNNNIGAPNKNLTSPSTTSASNKNANQLSSNGYHPTITMRLIVPASQCGSLIGRGGAKIKEIRETTGATIQIATDVLPNSTDRVVTISGNVESLKSCAYQICIIMIESPPKGYQIPYRPKQALNPMLLAAASVGQGAAAYNLPGQFAVTHPDVDRLFLNHLAALHPATAANLRAAATGQAAAALSAVASQSLTSQEMAIPNGLIGCVIGKGGSKINEIRQLSGANIKISNSEEGTKNRTVTISGTPEAINLAQYLITATCKSM